MFLVEPAVSGVFDPEDGQWTRLDKIIGTVQDAADTVIDGINKTADDLVERVGALETRVAAVEERVGKLETGGVETSKPEQTVDEWPEWVRPTSKDTQYHKGGQVTFNGRRYMCVKNNVSSSPDEDKKSWRLVE